MMPHFGHTNEVTDRHIHTHTQNDYCNPEAYARAPRVNIITEVGIVAFTKKIHS